MQRTKVFISYSHEDEMWRKRLTSHLSVLEYQRHLHIWDDTKIEAGGDWYQRIRDVITESRVAILVVTANFLTSKFILSEEIPALLRLHSESGLRILPLITRACPWKLVKWLAAIQVRPKDGTPLSNGSNNQVDSDLTEFAYEVAGLIERSPEGPEVHDVLDGMSSAMSRLDAAPSARELAALLVAAIEQGVPVYDRIGPVGCARIYAHAAKNFIELTKQPIQSEGRVSTAIIQAARQALGTIIAAVPEITEETADRLAWDLRYTFNWITGILLERRGLP